VAERHIIGGGNGGGGVSLPASPVDTAGSSPEELRRARFIRPTFLKLVPRGPEWNARALALKQFGQRDDLDFENFADRRFVEPRDMTPWSSRAKLSS